MSFLIGSEFTPISPALPALELENLPKNPCHYRRLPFLMADQLKFELGEEATPLDFLQKNLVDFFQNAPVGIHSLSDEGIILWANDAKLDSLGYTAEEFIGHPVTEVICLHSTFKVFADLRSLLDSKSLLCYFSSFLLQARKNF